MSTSQCKHTYRVAKTHRMPYLYRPFSAKEPMISGPFAKNDLQLKASYGSSLPCTDWSPAAAECHLVTVSHVYRVY